MCISSFSGKAGRKRCRQDVRGDLFSVSLIIAVILFFLPNHCGKSAQGRCRRSVSRQRQGMQAIRGVMKTLFQPFFRHHRIPSAVLASLSAAVHSRHKAKDGSRKCIPPLHLARIIDRSLRFHAFPPMGSSFSLPGVSLGSFKFYTSRIIRCLNSGICCATMRMIPPKVYFRSSVFS